MPLNTASYVDQTSAVNPMSELTVGQEAALASLPQGRINVDASYLKPQAAQAGAVVGVNDATREMYVNGVLFSVDDHQSALDSEKALSGPAKPIPAGFRAITPDEYKGYLNQIDNPSVGRLMSKNFGIGVDNLQRLGGQALRFAGAETMGKAIVDQQDKDLAYNAPYNRQFTDIKTPADAGMWFLANFAQQGPNLIQAIVTGGAGALIGRGLATSALGRLAAANGGSEAGLQRGLMTLAEKTYSGKTLDAVETAAVKEAQGILAKRGAPNAISDIVSVDSLDSLPVTHGAGALLSSGNAAARGAGAARGALVASGANNYATGVADIYGEQKDNGLEGDRLATAALALPYAALETGPEALMARTLMRGGLKGGFGRRVATGAGVGAVLEGGTEAGQEGLLFAGNAAAGGDLDKNWQERLVNSFAAGAAMGGPLGGLGGVYKQKHNVSNPDVPADLLSGGTTASPTGTPGTPGTPGDGSGIPYSGDPLQPLGVPGYTGDPLQQLTTPAYGGDQLTALQTPPYVDNTVPPARPIVGSQPLAPPAYDGSPVQAGPIPYAGGSLQTLQTPPYDDGRMAAPVAAPVAAPIGAQQLTTPAYTGDQVQPLAAAPYTGTQVNAAPTVPYKGDKLRRAKISPPPANSVAPFPPQETVTTAAAFPYADNTSALGAVPSEQVLATINEKTKPAKAAPVPDKYAALDAMGDKQIVIDEEKGTALPASLIAKELRALDKAESILQTFLECKP